MVYFSLFLRLRLRIEPIFGEIFTSTSKVSDFKYVLIYFRKFHRFSPLNLEFQRVGIKGFGLKLKRANFEDIYI